MDDHSGHEAVSTHRIAQQEECPIFVFFIDDVPAGFSLHFPIMKIKILTFLFLTALLSASCGERHAENCREDEEQHGDEIHFTAAQAKAAELRLETVAAGNFSHALRVGGRISATQGGEQTIAATADGIVAFSAATEAEGAAIRAGQTIATISSERLRDGDPAQKAKIAYEAAEKEYKRAEKLAAEHIIATRELEEATLRYETARVAYRAQAAQMIRGGVNVASPMGGFLKNRLVRPGEYVTMGTPIATVTQSRRLLLRAEVPQKYHKELAEITSARFKPAYDTDMHHTDRLNGRLVACGQTASDNGGFLPVTFEFDNVGNFVSGAYAEVFLLTRNRPNTISVPLSAVTEQQGINYVYVADPDEEEAYLQREVEIGQNNGERVEIKKGLSVGEKVVTRGAYQIKLAASSTMIPEGHTH